jgi:PAS domain S-box-containing protein
MIFSTPMKLIGLLLAILVAFVVALFALNIWESKRIDLVLHDKEIEHTMLLDQIVSLSGNSLSTVSFDFSRWDEMARFALQPDTQWARGNIDQSMPPYSIDAAWILDSGLHLLYSYNSINDPYLIRALPSFSQIAPIIPKRRFVHYFAMTTQGLLEIRSGPIQWQKDTLRTSTPLGYFLVGRLWTNDYLDKLSLLSGGSVTLNSGIDPKLGALSTDRHIISVVKSLPGPDGTTAAVITSRTESAFLDSMAEMSNRQAVVFAVFAISVLVFLAVSLSSLVRKPLVQITSSLRLQNPSVLKTLEKQKNEFGEIASLIVDFFAQKIQLESEMKERTRAQQELTQSEEKLNLWLDSLQEIVWVADLQKRWVYLNEAASKLFGCEKRELLGHFFAEMQLPQQIEKDNAAFARVLEGEILSSYETELLRKDGTRLAVSLSAKRLVDREGNVIGISGSAWDDTLRRQMEGALAEKEERFRTLVANIPGVVYRCASDAQYTMRYLSPEMQNLCGAPAEDFIGNRVRSFADIIHPDDRELVNRAVALAESRRESFTIEFRLLTADGSVKWVHEQGKPVFGPNGDVVWIDGVLLDVTDRKQVQQVIRDLEERNKQILNAIAEMIVVSGPDGKIIWANQAFLDFHNLTPDQLSVLEGDPVGNSFSDVFRLGITEDIPEETRRRHDGETRVFHTVRSPIFDSEDKPVMAVSLSRDITDKALIQEAQLLSERYFRTIIENSPDLVTVLDAEGRIRYQNSSNKTLLGYSLHELALHTWEKLIHPDDLETMRRTFAEILAGKPEPMPVRCRIRHKSGWWVMLETIGCSALDPHGIPVMIINSRQVDEKDSSEVALRESQSYLQAVFNTVQAGIFVVNAETGNTVDANLAALKLVGLSMNDVLGVPITKFILSGEGNAMTVQNDCGTIGQQTALIRADGTRAPIVESCQIATLHGHSCRVVSFVPSELQHSDNVAKQVSQSATPSAS